MKLTYEIVRDVVAKYILYHLYLYTVVHNFFLSKQIGTTVIIL